MNLEQSLALLAEVTGKLNATRKEHEAIVSAINQISQALRELEALKSEQKPG